MIKLEVLTKPDVGSINLDVKIKPDIMIKPDVMIKPGIMIKPDILIEPDALMQVTCFFMTVFLQRLLLHTFASVLIGGD